MGADAARLRALRPAQGVRERLLQRLSAARTQTDRLFAALDPRLLYERPIAERHRIVFYLGHLEAFDWNLLASRLGASSDHPSFDRLFAFGIDPVGGALPQDQPTDWPALAQVQHYRQQVRSRLDALLAGVPMQQPGPWDPAGRASSDTACLLSAAIEHRLMHAETLAYMFHRLPLGSLRGDLLQAPSPPASAATRPAPEHEAIAIPGGPVLMGQSRSNSAVFGWDNEFPQQALEVPAFQIDRHMVSNHQYLRFVVAGGYEDRAWWSGPDWAWKTASGIAHPGFWRRDGPRWLLRTMFAEIPLPPDWPVYVSHAEARAYALWAGKALPTEAQWLRAAHGTPQRTMAIDPPDTGYQESLGPPGGNFDFRRWDPEPVHAGDDIGHASAFGVAGLFGNGWEWTATPFSPAPGFEAFAFYPGYSKDFFDPHHFVLKGGSPRTAACMLRPSFRNWFQPHYPHAYTGFRCVTAATP